MHGMKLATAGDSAHVIWQVAEDRKVCTEPHCALATHAAW